MVTIFAQFRINEGKEAEARFRKLYKRKDALKAHLRAVRR